MYKTYLFENNIDWDKVPAERLSFFNWESETPYRPETSFQLAFSGDFLQVKMKTDETNLRTVCTKTNEPCWQDSCMEFFFAPFGKENGYINIECNPLGTYLSEFGKGREGRVFLNEKTKIEPVVEGNIEKDGWNLSIKVSYELIIEAFGKEFNPSACDFYADFFKCGDETDHPHYCSFTEMGELPPGFHNPDCFAKIEICKDY